MEPNCIQNPSILQVCRFFASFLKKYNKFLTIWLQSKTKDVIIKTNAGSEMSHLHCKTTKTYM